MSIIFFGTPNFAVPILKTLACSGEDISLVVTQPDKVRGRGHKLSPPPIKVTALAAGLRVAQPANLREESILKELITIKPELIIVVAYGKILPKAILELPRLGCINVHASLLPDYRGAAPIAWAIIRGEEKTGVTTMLMDEGLDTGALLLTRETNITEQDTGTSLGVRLSEMGATLLADTLKALRNGSVVPRPQTGKATYAPPLRKEDGLIDWSKNAVELSRFVRGTQPWPGAYCSINDERVTLLRASPVAGKGQPGAVIRIEKYALVVATGHDLLSVTTLQPSGKKPMSAEAFIHGRQLREGLILR
ncbi:MAG TPA: methionyl-tRNA formyltransferase [Thermodesulfovibrionales bacterium]|nr:methionyl-tRNA formyltransferase [Thermodesulfovibrionales bacterium]